MSARTYTLGQPAATTHDYRICERCGKRAYPSARKARAATRKAHNRIRIYYCPSGSGWHATDHEKGGGW